ncbi:spindle and kinetochore-associated protein 1 [Clupea harengus]|uniref:SKA complex subunit 1 n=1 Tax=Clupea harengus TaxID=7950 RepID=A0A6P3VHH8_CLUHA|nr:spindle and kinetochore-associated protein 1 [Clupea harengus]
MSHCELEELTEHINGRLTKVKNLMHLRAIGNDPEKQKTFCKIAAEVSGMTKLLDQFEKCVAEERESLKQLEELNELIEEDLQNAIHMAENIPSHMPIYVPTVKEEALPVQKENEQPQKAASKKSRKPIKEMEFITVLEFDSIPPYMKGRVTYDQLNATVRNMNKTVMEKYKILQQPPRTLNNVSRKLYERFKQNENGETKAHFFVVDADLHEFAQVTVNKRFLNLLNMLRHCQRLKEVRGAGLTRYQLL